MRRVVACLGAVVVLSAVLPAAHAHAVVEPGGCQDVRATGSVMLRGERVTAWVYERSCGAVVTVEDASVTTAGAVEYRATVDILRPGSRGLVLVASATDGAASTCHVIPVWRSTTGVVVRVVLTSGKYSATIGT